MASTKGTSGSEDPPTLPPTLSSPLQPVTLNAATETHGNNVLPPSSLLVSAPRSPLWPADCFAAPNSSNDKVQDDYGDEANEASEGYEDGEVSMELDDVVGKRRGSNDAAHKVAQKGDSIVSKNTDESMYEWSDSDTIEDTMDALVSVELECFATHERRVSRQFSPLIKARRATADARPSYSFITLPASEPSVISTPRGTHLESTPNVSELDTPFSKCLHYLKHHKGKENWPSKSRRNASLPEELAELAREAKEEEDLEKYRELDPAPMDPVMASDAAGDLITFSTPIKITDGAPMAVLQVHAALTNSPEAFPQQLQASSACLSLHVEQDDSDDAGSKCTDATSCPPERQLMVYPQHPTCVTVMGLLPKTLFWVVAAPIFKYSSRAYDALVESVGSFEL